ncbi:DUF998 domain-containing protein [Defluviitalea raffinosedens]|uniref:DUF998 domain-containing protein n=1 Tax=Defluviitalea raffinosedens TaxID=1450156 RepID=A0A7C8HCV5_9FIRM|nr:DUF998 domain-containing protein [Defluviitalea raffinosedens]KAE9627804.1 DUF998 domain-containing protein [Defluviitalea raffinosedens]MBM7687244.1 putative membrane protein [Defluviitalea raffinosedens]HHW67146.1 DUF998 domain-containing protein [Candidatus Epulonipiscium sp.]
MSSRTGFITKYGWYALLIAIIGDLLIPFILAPFYEGYSNTSMTISALGNSQSPVRSVFNIWMFIEGILFLAAIPALYDNYHKVSKILLFMTIIFIIIFAVGACILTCFFSVNESKDVVTAASIIHGVGSVIGFTLFLFVPLLLAILSFKGNDKITGIISVISFILAFLFFVLFILADKPEFSKTIAAKEGLWQRMNLLFMYLPLGYISLTNIYKLIR